MKTIGFKYFHTRILIIEAMRWFKLGDVSDVVQYTETTEDDFASDYYDCCSTCDIPFINHGWLTGLKGTDGYIVCPGDWIIIGINGKKYPCKPDIFELTYEECTDA